MKKILFAMFVFCFMASSAFASSNFSFNSESLGYTGTVNRYDSMADAQAGINSLETISIGNRDAGVYQTHGTYGAQNIFMGTWWFTTDPSGRMGYGNTRGNTGVGFAQLYDSDASTVNSASGVFQNYQGGYWTEFAMSVSGQNASPAEDYSRFSIYNNTNDAGTYYDYNLNLTVSGLQGTATGNGNEISATNAPTGVTGNFYGLFQFGGDGDGYPDSWDLSDFYVIELDFNMENWAAEMEGADLLTGDYTSLENEFVGAATPIPGAIWLLGSGIVGLAGIRRRMKK
jgi:hypothetical protein